LRLGLHGSIKYLGVDFDADRTIVIDPNDESILENSQLNDYNANFGFGVISNWIKFIWESLSPISSEMRSELPMYPVGRANLSRLRVKWSTFI
jgi:hypothetical protein